MASFAERARARSTTPVFPALPALAALLLATGMVLLAPRALMAGEPDDISAYRAQYGQPPPPGAYPGQPAFARQKLMEHLNYAEAQYEQARRAGDREAARHWRKQIKRLRRELSESAHAAWAPMLEPPPSSFPGPGYPGYGYAQPYMPAPYPSQTPPVVAAPYGRSSGGLTSLLGPLLGAGPAQSPAAYPAYQGPGYPGPGYPAGAVPNGAAGAPAMGGIGSLLGPLFGARSAP